MKYFIKWDCGYGDMHDVVDADSREEADEMAYDAWKEEAETNASYSAEEFTQEVAEDYGYEWDE